MQKETVIELVKYTINGICTTAVNYIIYSLMLWMNIHYLLANSIAWFGAVMFAYYTNRKLVFHSNKAISKELLSFLSLRFLTLWIENALLWISIQSLSFDLFSAKILVSVITIVANYAICKSKIFSKGVTQNG